MENILYIYVIEGMGNADKHYVLCLKDTHFGIATGSSLDDMERAVKYFVRTYRTEERLLDAVGNLSMGNKEPDKTIEIREEWYQLNGYLYSGFIKRCVKEEWEVIKEERKRNNPFKKTLKRLESKITKKEAEVKPAIPEEVGRVVKKKLVTKKVLLAAE